MNRLKAYLAIGGTVCLVSALTGIGSISVGTEGTSIAHLNTWIERVGVVAYGALLLWLAYGIHSRLAIAWRVGFAALIAGWAYFLVYVSLFIAHDPQPYRPYERVGSVALIMCFASLVLVYWGRRWYAQRGFFTHEG